MASNWKVIAAAFLAGAIVPHWLRRWATSDLTDEWCIAEALRRHRDLDMKYGGDTARHLEFRGVRRGQIVVDALSELPGVNYKIPGSTIIDPANPVIK